jgi:hypothetical protein
MARNVHEQIVYLMKRRKGGMSNADFQKELERLYDLGFEDGRGYDIPTASIRD